MPVTREEIESYVKFQQMKQNVEELILEIVGGIVHAAKMPGPPTSIQNVEFREEDIYVSYITKPDLSGWFTIYFPVSYLWDPNWQTKVKRCDFLPWMRGK